MDDDDDIDKLLYGTQADVAPKQSLAVVGAVDPLQVPSLAPDGATTLQVSENVLDYGAPAGLAGGGPWAQTPAQEAALVATALRASVQETRPAAREDAMLAEALRISTLEAGTGSHAQESVTPVQSATFLDTAANVALQEGKTIPELLENNEDALLAEALRLSLEESHGRREGVEQPQEEQTGSEGHEGDWRPGPRRIKWAGDSDSATLEQLAEMGFQRDLASKALLEEQDSVERALELLTQTQPLVENDEAPPSYESEMGLAGTSTAGAASGRTGGFRKVPTREEQQAEALARHAAKQEAAMIEEALRLSKLEFERERLERGEAGHLVANLPRSLDQNWRACERDCGSLELLADTRCIFVG
jgi:hypothetical protein